MKNLVCIVFLGLTFHSFSKANDSLFRSEIIEEIVIQAKRPPLIDPEAEIGNQTVPELDLFFEFDSTNVPVELKNSEEFRDYLNTHLSYTTYAIKMGYEGKIRAQFNVDKQGYLQNVTIVKGLSPDLDKQVLLVFTNMPKLNFDFPIKSESIRFEMAIKFELID